MLEVAQDIDTAKPACMQAHTAQLIHWDEAALRSSYTIYSAWPLQ